MRMDRQQHGVLYPQRLPEFHRIAPPTEIEHAVSWFWIPEWDLPPGEESRQELLPFPACNLVIESEAAIATGPSTRRSERVLSGRGWAVGALIRPAAAPALVPDLARLRDGARPLDEPELRTAVAAAMSDPAAGGETRRAAAVEAFAEWIAAHASAPPPGSSAALANELGDALADPSITRVDELAPRLHASTRTLQRLAERHFGLPLHAMIRRRRLQEAAERLRNDPNASVGRLASELGYADHAHFTTDFTALLGVAPSRYRQRVSAESAGTSSGARAPRA